MKRKGEKVGEEGDLKDSRAWASEKRHKSLGTSSVKKNRCSVTIRDMHQCYCTKNIILKYREKERKRVNEKSQRKKEKT